MEKHAPGLTRRRSGELLRKLFEVLMKSPEGKPAAAALEELARSVQLTEYDAGTYASGGRRFEKNVRFDTVECVRAGWLVKNKGIWTLTEAGLEGYKTFTDPEAFRREVARLYHLSLRGREGRAQESAGAEAEPDAEDAEKSARITFEEAEEQAWGEIEAHVGAMDPYEFQRLVADLLKAMGYYPSWVSPPGRDGGLDIVAHADPLGTRPPRIKVQVKRQQQRVDRHGVSAFLAHVNEDDAGLFVCIGGFTRDAEDFARMQERRKITLIDLARLVGLWVEFYPKLDDLARDRLRLTPIYFLTPRG
jgi:restriction system protein